MANELIKHLTNDPVFVQRVETGEVEKQVRMYLNLLAEKGYAYFCNYIYHDTTTETFRKHEIELDSNSAPEISRLVNAFARTIIREAMDVYDKTAKRLAVVEFFRQPNANGNKPDLYKESTKIGLGWRLLSESDTKENLSARLRGITQTMFDTPDMGSNEWEWAVMESAIGNDSKNVARWQRLLEKGYNKGGQELG